MRTVEPTIYPLPGIDFASEERPRVSILIPVSERHDPLEGLYIEYVAPLRESGLALEVLILTEPWGRRLATELQPLIDEGEPIRILSVGQTVGETNLLKVGAAHARGEILLTLPAFRRVAAASLPALIEEVEAGADLVLARRWPRRDGWINRLQNRVFHAILGTLTASRVHDTACGVLAMPRQVLLELPVYGDYFRFLALFAMREGYTVREIPAEQHRGDARVRVFSPGTYVRRILDVIGLFFLLRFTEKPLRFFGLVGSVFAGAGILLLLALLVERVGGQGIAERPLLVLSVLLLVVGLQAIALGLIGEIIVHLNAPNRRPYRVLRDVEGTPGPISQVGPRATASHPGATSCWPRSVPSTRMPRPPGTPIGRRSSRSTTGWWCSTPHRSCGSTGRSRSRRSTVPRSPWPRSTGSPTPSTPTTPSTQRAPNCCGDTDAAERRRQPTTGPSRSPATPPSAPTSPAAATSSLADRTVEPTGRPWPLS
jgi:hypothetical protein